MRFFERREPGQALVEFALVLPIIVLFLLGLLDLGRAVYSYNTLAQASRQAARVAIVNQGVDAVRSQAISSGVSLGLSSSNVDVCFKSSDSTSTDCSSTSGDCPQSTRVIGCLAVVRTHLSYTPMTPVISLILSSINLSSTSIEPIEYVCPEGVATTCS